MTRLESAIALVVDVAFEVLQQARNHGPLVAAAEVASITLNAVLLAAGAVAVATVALPVALALVLVAPGCGTGCASGTAPCRVCDDRARRL